jgi:hypothetical protein
MALRSNVEETETHGRSQRAVMGRSRGESFFTGQDMAGAVLIVIMIWGPLAAGAFIGS